MCEKECCHRRKNIQTKVSNIKESNIKKEPITCEKLKEARSSIEIKTPGIVPFIAQTEI